MELVIAAADSWPSLMEKRPLYRGFKAIQQNALSSVSVCISIFTLPLSPTCSQSSLSTRSAGLLPACAPGKWAKESKHYIHRKNTVYTVWQIQRTKTIPMTICVTFTMLCMKESPHKQSKLTVSTAICDLRAPLHPPAFHFFTPCHLPLFLSFRVNGVLSSTPLWQ